MVEKVRSEKSKSKTSNSSSAAVSCYNVDIINTTWYTQKSILTGSDGSSCLSGIRMATKF